MTIYAIAAILCDYCERLIPEAEWVGIWVPATDSYKCAACIEDDTPDDTTDREWRLHYSK